MEASAAGRGSGKLSLATKLAYGAGDIFGGGAMVIVGFFYLFFLTEVAHLSAALAGTMFLVIKVWDAISDPLMGFISDRTRSRFGRRRVYFLAGIAPIAASFFLLWLVPGAASQWWLFTYYLVVNVLFDIVITMTMVPYNALIPELTLDYDERSSLTGYRLAFSNLATLLCAALPPLIVGMAASPAAGYRNMAAVFGLLFALPWIGVFLVSFERGAAAPAPESNLLRDAAGAFRNRSFRLLLGLYLLTFLAIDVVSAVMMYYLTYVIEQPGQATPVLGLLLLSQLLALPVYVRIAHRFEKRISFLIGAAIWAVLLPPLAFLGPGTPIWVVYLLAVLVGAGISGAAFSPWAMLPDVLDLDLLVTGQSRQGIYSGVMTFLRKVSSAVALFIVGQVIHFSGYVADGVQPPPFISAVRVLVGFAPILLIAAAALVARHYALTPARYGVVRSALARRLAGAGEPDPDPAAAGVLAMLYGPRHGPGTGGGAEVRPGS